MPVFLHTFQRENTYAKLHENAPFEMKNYKNFHCPLPRLLPHRGGGYPSSLPGAHRLGAFGASTLLPSFDWQLPRMSSDPRNAPERVYFTRPLQPRDHITAAALPTLHSAASASRHYVGPTSYAYTDARLRLRICAHLSTRRPRAMHSHCCQEELIYTVDGQRMFRRTTSVIVSRISSVLCCRPASLEQTACSPSTY